MRERFVMIDAIAMIGTACRGPNITTSTGISMIDEPKPTIPPTTPATRPTLKTKKYSKNRRGAVRARRETRRGYAMRKPMSKRAAYPAPSGASASVNALPPSR